MPDCRRTLQRATAHCFLPQDGNETGHWAGGKWRGSQTTFCYAFYRFHAVSIILLLWAPQIPYTCSCWFHVNRSCRLYLFFGFVFSYIKLHSSQSTAWNISNFLLCKSVYFFLGTSNLRSLLLPRLQRELYHSYPKAAKKRLGKSSGRTSRGHGKGCAFRLYSIFLITSLFGREFQKSYCR